jgi:hypothetical protein
MKRLILILSACLLLSLLNCSSVPTVTLPYVLDTPSTKAKVVLDSEARIIVGQPVKRGATCEKVKSSVSSSVVNENKNEKVLMKLSCTDVRGAVALISPVLQKGNYLVEVKGGDEPLFSDTPSIVLRYPDPDFRSGADQEMEGAKELLANQTMKGVANYSGGVSTQWVHLKGKKGNVSLTFFEEGDGGRWLNAQVFSVASDGASPKLVGILLPKKKRDFKIEDDNLFVKVSAREFGGERKYSLLRHDSAGKGKGGGSGAGFVGTGPRSVVGVIDVYPVGDSSAVVLLKVTSTLKLNDEVAIFGKKIDGNSVSLGKCTVTGISDGQASCHLEEASLTNIVEYRAEANGGQAS